jgi:hypothetical protein
VLIGGFRRVLTTLYVGHLLDLQLGDYFRKAYLRPFAIFSILIPVAVFGAYTFPSENLFGLAVKVCLTAFLWVVLFLSIGITKSERDFAAEKAVSFLRGKRRSS